MVARAYGFTIVIRMHKDLEGFLTIYKDSQCSFNFIHMLTSVSLISTSAFDPFKEGHADRGTKQNRTQHI